jgi:autotransporter-associated beta strand protein
MKLLEKSIFYRAKLALLWAVCGLNMGQLLAQTTVTYTQQTGNYYAQYAPNAGCGSSNNGSYQVLQYANTTAPKQTVRWRKFRTDGSGSSTGDRALQVGDVFTVRLSATRAYGRIGFALLSSPAATAAWADRESNYALSVNLDGPLYLGGTTYGNWYVKYNGGATSAASFGGVAGGTYNDFTFTLTLTAPDRMNVTITNNTTSTSSNFYDLQLNNSNPITDYSIFLEDDYDGSVGSKNIYWGLGALGTQHSVTNNGSLNHGQSNNSYTVSGVITNGLNANSASTNTLNNSLTKNGTGALTLSGTNTYTGTTAIATGTLAIGNNSAFGTGAISLAAATLQSAGSGRTIANTITFTGNPAVAGSNDITLNGTLSFNGSRTLTVSNTASTTIAGNVYIAEAAGSTRTATINGSGSVTINGVVADFNGVATANSSLTYNGTGILTLNGVNTYSGTTTVFSGTVAIGNNSSFGTSTLSFGGSGSNTPTIQAVGGAKSISNNTTLLLTAIGNPTISGFNDFALNGTLTNSGGNRTLSVNNSASTTVTGNVYLSELSTSGRTLIINGTGNTAISGVISDFNGTGLPGSLTYSGTGALTLSGANTYGGTTSLSSGTLNINNTSAIGTGSFLINGGTVDNTTGGAITLTTNNPVTWGGDFACGGTQDLNFGTGAVILSASRTITLNGTGRTLSFGGNVTNTTTSPTLTVNGAGNTLVLGALALSNSSTNRTVTIAGSGNAIIFGVVSNGGTAPASNLAYSGSGTLTLSGANTYAGITTINSGTIQLGAANAIPNSSNITLGGGTLSTGATTGFSETAGTLTLSVNSTIALGTGSHTLTFANSSGISWGTRTLTITGWTGSVGTSGTAGQIFVGVGGLSAAQLLQVSFSGFAAGGQILATGELVPAAIPTISSFAGSPGGANSGYIGSTVTITGTNFVGVTSVTANTVNVGSFTVVNSTTITFISSATTTGTIRVINAAGTGTSAGTYNNLGYITASGATDWDTPASWLGGSVPPTGATTTIDNNLNIATAVANSPATVTVNSGSTLNVNNAAGALTSTVLITNNGTVSFSNTGSLTAKAFTNNGTLSWTAAGTLNISASGTLTNNGTYTGGTGTLLFAGAGTLAGTPVLLNNLTITTGTVTLSAVPTIDGIFTINGGNISVSGPTVSYTANSTLVYNIAYNRFLEWNASGAGTIGDPGYPNNVTINGNFNLANGSNAPRALDGLLTINSGNFSLNSLNATFTVGNGVTVNSGTNFNMGNTTGAVNITGPVSVAGTFTQATSSGPVSITGAVSVSGILTQATSSGALNITGAVTVAATGNFNQGTTSTGGTTINGSLTNSGGLITMTTNTGGTGDLVVTGALANNSGTLTLAAISGDLRVGGDLSNGGTFTHKNRAVFFTGSAQTVSGSFNTSGASNSFAYILINNGTNVTLGSNVYINNNLTFNSGKLILSTYDLTLANAATITTPTTSSYIKTNSTGQLKRTVGGTFTNILFPVGNSTYNPITLSNSGTSDVYGLRVADNNVPNANDVTKTVGREWYVTEAVAGGSNLYPVVLQYNTGDNIGANFNAGTTPIMGLWNGTAWTQVSTTLAGSNPFTASSSISNQFPVTIPAGSYFAISKDNGLATPFPVISSFTPTTGYTATTVVVTGYFFTGATSVTIGGTAVSSFTVNSDNQITLAVGTGASGVISVTTPIGTGNSVASFTYLGYITTTNGDWTTPATWLNGSVPPAGAAATVAHNITVSTNLANFYSLVTINSGATLDISNAAGNLTIASLGKLINNGTLTWSAPGTLTITGNSSTVNPTPTSLTNNGTFNRGTGTVIFSGPPSGGYSIDGTSTTTFYNLYLNTGILSLNSIPIIDGTLKNSGGSFSAPVNQGPIYTINSTLEYAVTLQRTAEWIAAGAGTIGTTMGYPNNVLVSGGTFTLLNGDVNVAKAINGNLTINAGATFNFGGKTNTLTVKGSITNGGNFALSTSIGGDLLVGGDFTNNGTFTHNSRLVTFNGSSAQAIGGSAGFGNASGNASNRFPYLTIANTATYPAGVSASVDVNAGTSSQASFTVNAGSLYEQTAGTFTLIGGATGNVNSGSYLRNSGATVTNSGTLNFLNGSFYEHNHKNTQGAIPLATWVAGSTCSIIGYTTSNLGPSGGLGQSFCDFVWNCPSQSVATQLSGGLTTVLGNLTITSTGTGSVRLATSNGATPATLNVTGNLNVAGGYLSIIGGGTSGSNTSTIAVGGTLNVSSGTLDFTDGSPAGGATINLSGNFSQTGGTIQRSSASTASLNFVKPGTQTISQTAATVLNAINWNVGTASNNVVQLVSNFTIGNAGAATFNLLSGSTLDFQTYQLQGSGSFIANAGGTLLSANTDAAGTFTTSGANGSVRTTTRTFTNAGVNYVFNGSSAQNTGNAVGAAASIGTLTVNNSNHVSLGASTTVTGTVALNSGRLLLGNVNLILPSSGAVSGVTSSLFIETNGTGELRIPIVTGSSIVFPVGRSTPSVQYMPATFNFTSNTPVPNNLAVRAVTPRNTNDGTSTDYINNRWWYTNIDSTYGEYTYSAQYTYFAGDVFGTIGNIKLNNWNGSSWAGIPGSSASGTTLSSGTVTDADGNLANAQWAGRAINPSVIYTWINNSGGPWTTNTNWSPTGVPGSGDEVTFTGASTFTVTNVPTGITLKKLTFSGTAKVTWQPALAGAVNVGSGTAPQLSLSSGNTLTLDGGASSTTLNLNILAGNTAQIDGTLILRRGGQRFTATTASSVTFSSGSRFVAGQSGESPAYTGNPFGTTGTANVMVFQSGSVFESFAGANPFGLTQPASRVVFQTGSLYKHSSSLAISSLGRTYANFEYNQNSSSASLNATGAAMVMDNLTVSQGTLNLDLAGTPGHTIKGNITIAAGAALSMAPASSGTVNLSGTGTQVISGNGTFTTGANSTLNITNNTAGGVSLQKNITAAGTVNVASGGNFYIKDENILSGTGGFTLNSGASLGVGSANGIGASGATGNVQTTARTFNSGASYTYNGAVNQVTGTGLPSTVTGVVSISNTGTNPTDIVTLTTNNTTVSTLNFVSGRFAAGTGQTIKIAAGGTVNGSGYSSYTGNQVWNDPTGGTIEFTGSGAVRGSAFNLYNVTIGNSGGGVDFTNNSTIYNSFQINALGLLNPNAPKYAVGSTLIYNILNAGYNRSIEWGQVTPLAAGYPHHVIVQNGTTLNLQNGGNPPSLEIGGDLTIGNGSQNGIVNMNAATVPLKINGNLLIGNTSVSGSQLNLSNVNGADLWLYGNFTRWGTNQFNDNSRATYFKGTGNASINTPGVTITAGVPTQNFAYARIDKTNGTEQITLNCPVGISNEITLTKGIINTTLTNLLVVNATTPGSVIGGSSASYISGPIRRFTAGTTGTYLFPIGDVNSAGYRALTLATVSNPSTSTYFTGEYKNANPPAIAGPDVFLTNLLGIQKNEYWQLDRAGGTTTGKVTLTYVNPGANWRDNTGAPITPCASCNVAIVKRTTSSGAGNWDFTGLPGTFNNFGTPPESLPYATPGDIISQEVTSFSPFAFGFSYDVILPVKLVSFGGQLQGTAGRLNWQVANLADLKDFELQYSTDGHSFSKLASIAASGSDTYLYTHASLQTGANFYRLKVNDKNGSSFYSQVVVLNVGAIKTQIIGLKNNPVFSDVTPLILSATSQQAKAIITDASGRLIGTQQTTLAQGSNQWRINGVQMSVAGLYFITIKTADGVTATLKFMKQ